MKSEKKGLKRLRSLNITLWKNFCFLAFFVILLVGVICYLIVQGSITGYTQDKIRGVGVSVGGQLKEMANNANLASLFSADEYIEKEAFENNVNIAVMTLKGDIVLPVDQRMSESEREYWEDAHKSIIDRISEFEGSGIQFATGNVFTYAEFTPFASSPESPNYIAVRYSMDVARGTMGFVQRYMIILGILVILIAFLISYSMAQKISDPLKSLTTSANKMAKGDYSVKFASADYREMAQLSDALNYACAEIKKSDDFQKELLANVSHDLRTPLTMIKAYASMIKEISGDDREKRDKHLQVIIDESDRLAELVNDVLNMSKISSDMNRINKKVFNLTDFLYGIMQKFEYLQELKGYSFETDIDPDVYTCADEGKIGQVLYNLISNAVNYTGEDKKVYVSLKLLTEGGRARFTVRDTGKGISKEDLPSIWNRYYRVKETHSRPVKGTGLGLPIVKTILEKHSFDFGAESEQGKGSTFRVDFPVVPPEPPGSSAEPVQ